MSLNESFKAGSEARDYRRGSAGLASDDPQGVFSFAVRSFDLPLPVQPTRSGHSDEAYQGDLRDACTLRISQSNTGGQLQRVHLSDMDLWAYQRGVILDFSRPGKPTDNAFIVAFNGKLRSECLNAHWFLSLQDACEKLEAWRRHYNEERPHSAIGNIPPIILANSTGETSPPNLSKAQNSRPERSKVG